MNTDNNIEVHEYIQQGEIASIRSSNEAYEYIAHEEVTSRTNEVYEDIEHDEITSSKRSNAPCVNKTQHNTEVNIQTNDMQLGTQHKNKLLFTNTCKKFLVLLFCMLIISSLIINGWYFQQQRNAGVGEICNNIDSGKNATKPYISMITSSNVTLKDDDGDDDANDDDAGEDEDKSINNNSRMKMGSRFWNKSINTYLDGQKTKIASVTLVKPYKKFSFIKDEVWFYEGDLNIHRYRKDGISILDDFEGKFVFVIYQIEETGNGDIMAILTGGKYSGLYVLNGQGFPEFQIDSQNEQARPFTAMYPYANAVYVLQNVFSSERIMVVRYTYILNHNPGIVKKGTWVKGESVELNYNTLKRPRHRFIVYRHCNGKPCVNTQNSFTLRIFITISDYDMKTQKIHEFNENGIYVKAHVLLNHVYLLGIDKDMNLLLSSARTMNYQDIYFTILFSNGSVAEHKLFGDGMGLDVRLDNNHGYMWFLKGVPVDGRHSSSVFLVYKIDF